jgi:hypothetical protein
MVGTDISLICLLPAQFLGMGPDPLIEGLLGACIRSHRHADLSSALVAPQHIALDGHDTLGLLRHGRVSSNPSSDYTWYGVLSSPPDEKAPCGQVRAGDIVWHDLGESDAKGGGMGLIKDLQEAGQRWLGRKRRAMAYHPSAIPAVPVFPQPEICPECRGPLADPSGQAFLPSFDGAASPSKVCETCCVGYWLEDVGWMNVATVAPVSPRAGRTSHAGVRARSGARRRTTSPR